MIQYKLKWMDVIQNLDAGNITRICRKSNVTYAHCVKILNDMIEKKLIKRIQGKNKREYYHITTPKGDKVIKACMVIYTCVNINND